MLCCVCCVFLCFFQAEDGIRDLVRSRGLGDVYKRQNPSGFLQGRQILVGDYFIGGLKHFYNNYQCSLNQLFLYLQA